MLKYVSKVLALLSAQAVPCFETDFKFPPAKQVELSKIKVNLTQVYDQIPVPA